MKSKIPPFLLFLFPIILGSCAPAPKNAQPISNFDKTKYLGKWYEIARLDVPFERGLNNTSGEYSLRPDGLIKVKNQGFNPTTQKWKESIGKAKFRGAETTGALKVSFFGPFYGQYNIVALDPNYTYALVTGGSTKYLWILSRKKTIPAEIKATYLKKAQDMGFDTSQLIWPIHDKKPLPKN